MFGRLNLAGPAAVRSASREVRIASTTDLTRASHRTLTWKAALFEVSVATVAYLAYFLVRGLTESGFERAKDNAEQVIRFESWIGLYHERTVQDAIANHERLVNLANWVYIWGHWPVIIAVGAWLMRSNPAEYRILRNSFLLSGAIGLVVFVLFPVAPPRLIEAGLIDTVTERSHAYRVLQPPAFVNQYAAMPSLHFGWDLLIGVILVRHAGSRFFRAIGFLLPVAMAWAVVATANHFLIDGVAGAAVALFGFAVASLAAPQLHAAQESLLALPEAAVRACRRGAT
jgi:hypothetical protein